MSTKNPKVIQNTAEQQEENLAKLVMSTFYKLSENKNGTTSEEIAKYLRENFGDIWRTSVLVTKAEQTLSRSAALGFLEQLGKRYAVSIARGACCSRQRRGRRVCGCPKRRRMRSCGRKRRQRSCKCKRRRRRRRRRRSC
ncbi:uncharacterized protein LOC128683279 [Plodia interpunctella]|uniref:uncharacterized protein LOC128683279 n=1 Tax=Plodia interpunctella TaxID=58824 RepID=UPI0023686499|nr:uncharacterized protein LOC128683279 [Plodia interpunctella]